MTKKSPKVYFSIEGERTAETKIKRSLFICSLKYVETMAEARDFISTVSREHKNATHNCWAYIVGERGETSHASDSGEPPGTAGPPILSTLERYSMTNIASVVTRYFGGVKLGIKGLIQAYSRSVAKAVELEKLKKLVVTRRYVIEVPYTFNDTLNHHIKNLSGHIIKSDYAEAVTHELEVPRNDWNRTETLLQKFQHSGNLTYKIIR